MPKRRKWFFLLAGAVLVLALFLFLTQSNEPRYQGRTLSYWIAQRASDDASEKEIQESDDAIRHIGTNALRFFLKWIQHEPPPWQRQARRILPSFIQNTSVGKLLVNGPGDERASEVTIAYGVLGTNAASTIPDLNILITDTTHLATAKRAIVALGGLGAPALTSMAAALANTNLPNVE